MKKHFPIAAFLAVALASLAMAASAYVAVDEAARIKFEATADDALSRIDSRINFHLSLLRATNAYFITHGGNVDAADFRVYFEALNVEKNFEGLRGIGFLGLSDGGGRAALSSCIHHSAGGSGSTHTAAGLPENGRLVKASTWVMRSMGCNYEL